MKLSAYIEALARQVALSDSFFIVAPHNPESALAG